MVKRSSGRTALVIIEGHTWRFLFVIYRFKLALLLVRVS